MIRKFSITLLCLVGLSCNSSLDNLDSQSVKSDSYVEKVNTSAIASPALTGSRLPRLRTLPNGDVLMSWIETEGDWHALKFSVLHDGRWVRQGEVARGEGWFINWADYPSVVAIDEAFWVAHWLVKQQGGKAYDYDIATSISIDAGITWSTHKSPHRDGAAAEHGFAATFPVGRDAGIVWLDGREYVKKEDRAKHPNQSGNFALRYTRLNRDGSMTPEQVIDSNTCTCCWPSVAVATSGPVAVWRGRTDGEIRDNRVSYLRDGKWSKPAELGSENWHIEGCPVNGPAIAAQGQQMIAAWFSAEGNRPRVRAAFSSDGGMRFGTPVEVDDITPVGRISLAWRDHKTAVVSWMTAPDPVTKKSHLALRTIHVNGTLGEIRRVLKVSAGRDTGVPQMVANDKELVLAWTGSAPTYGVQTAFVSWDGLQSMKSSEVKYLGQSTQAFMQTICGRSH